MACCAMPGGCADPECRLCSIIAQLPKPGQQPDLQKNDRAELKDSKPVLNLSAPRAAAVALGKVKRKRVGPHR